MKRYAWPLGYGLALALFTLWLALDTFVIPRTYGMSAPAPVESDLTAPTERIQTGTAYIDENIHIQLTEYREHETTIYVADVTISAPSLLRTALANNEYGRNVKATTSQIAEEVDAILAINGDFYGSQERGYVARNGHLLRDTVARDREDRESLAIMADGSFRIVIQGDVSAQSLMDEGAVHILSFGPALVVDGEIAVTREEEVGRAMEDNPRTAIGCFDDPGHYILLVADGRTRESEGLSLHELAAFMQELGVTTAYNLDGGGSSTMVFNGELINNPTTSGRRNSEREVSDIVFIGY